jgi:hypothetical protein
MRNGPFHVAVILEISVDKSTTTLSPGEKWRFLVFLSYQAFILVRGPTEILKLTMTGEDVEKSIIEHVINVRERLSEMRDIVGKNLTDKQSNMAGFRPNPFRM